MTSAIGLSSSSLEDFDTKVKELTALLKKFTRNKHGEKPAGRDGVASLMNSSCHASEEDASPKFSETRRAGDLAQISVHRSPETEDDVSTSGGPSLAGEEGSSRHEEQLSPRVPPLQSSPSPQPGCRGDVVPSSQILTPSWPSLAEVAPATALTRTRTADKVRLETSLHAIVQERLRFRDLSEDLKQELREIEARSKSQRLPVVDSGPLAPLLMRASLQFQRPSASLSKECQRVSTVRHFQRERGLGGLMVMRYETLFH